MNWNLVSFVLLITKEDITSKEGLTYECDENDNQHTLMAAPFFQSKQYHI